MCLYVDHYVCAVAGCVAARMGLPLRLVAAVNTNDIVSRILSSGDFSKADEVVVSLAPAMDIQVNKKNTV